MSPLPTQYTTSLHTQTGIYTALRSIIHALSRLSTTHWSAVLSAPVTNTARHELHHIKTSVQLNGYKHFNFNQPKPSLPPEERPQFKSTITLPYISHTSHKLQHIFSQAQIKIFHTAPNKIQASLQTHKDKQDTQDKAGVYRIPCKKYTLERQGATYLQESRNTKHTAD